MARKKPDLVEFDRDEVRRLLGLLDEQLRRRGLSGSVYVVGGAAVALTLSDRRVTQDIDARITDQAVVDEAQALAAVEGIPPSWLNSAAAGWIPARVSTVSPKPEEGLPTTKPGAPGLHVTIAPPQHLLAMKMIAMRVTDQPDIVALARYLGMLPADPQDFAQILHDVYHGEDELQGHLGVPYDDVEVEALRRGEQVSRLIGIYDRRPGRD